MSKVLVIKAHPNTSKSLSLIVGKEFINSYKKSHPDDEVIIRDLYAEEGVPPLNDVTMEAWRKQKFGEEMSQEEKNLLNQHAEWLDELISADKYVFINPMYNHFLPAELKQYLDLTAVAHKTFKYTAQGPVGLLKSKKEMHIQAVGGFYHDEKHQGALPDLGSIYLDNTMKFYGVDKIDSIYIEGADAVPNQRQAILDTAMEQALTKAKEFQ